MVLSTFRHYMLLLAELGRGGRVFVGAEEATLRRNHCNVLWHKACAKVGIKGPTSMIFGTQGTP